MTHPVRLAYFSDVLCVWAYAAQIRLDELQRQLGDKVTITHHFINIFGCTEKRIGEGWAERGGYDGFCRHVVETCQRFEHLKIDERVWRECIPSTSGNAHLLLKAVQLLEAEGVVASEPVAMFEQRSLFEEFMWRIRCAFFEAAIDISQAGILATLAESVGLPVAKIQEKVDDGSAMAALCRDAERQQQLGIEGSPSYVLNEGRQKLYGNVGYRIIEANVLELLERPETVASWC